MIKKIISILLCTISTAIFATDIIDALKLAHQLQLRVSKHTPYDTGDRKKKQTGAELLAQEQHLLDQQSAILAEMRNMPAKRMQQAKDLLQKRTDELEVLEKRFMEEMVNAQTATEQRQAKEREHAAKKIQQHWRTIPARQQHKKEIAAKRQYNVEQRRAAQTVLEEEARAKRELEEHKKQQHAQTPEGLLEKARQEVNTAYQDASSPNNAQSTINHIQNALEIILAKITLQTFGSDYATIDRKLSSPEYNAILRNMLSTIIIVLSNFEKEKVKIALTLDKKTSTNYSVSKLIKVLKNAGYYNAEGAWVRLITE